MFETSALKLFAVASLHYQLICRRIITSPGWDSSLSGWSPSDPQRITWQITLWITPSKCLCCISWHEETRRILVLLGWILLCLSDLQGSLRDNPIDNPRDNPLLVPVLHFMTRTDWTNLHNIRTCQLLLVALPTVWKNIYNEFSCQFSPHISLTLWK